MSKKIDFYTAAAPVALLVGFGWVYFSMVVLKIPGWPAMVGMAAYYAVGGLACHERHDNGLKSIKGLLLGVFVSWIAVAIWTVSFKGNPVAMAFAMGAIAAVLVYATKIRVKGDYPFIALPQAFLGATIFFGLFNTFMMAKGVPDSLLFGSLQSLVLKGPAQPNVAGTLGVLSAVVGVLLGYIHQNVSLAITNKNYTPTLDH